MADMIRLVQAGQLDLEELRAYIEEQSERPATLEMRKFPGTDDDYFSIQFKDPFNRRYGREINGHMSTKIGEPHDDFVGDGEYTTFSMGEAGNAANIMRLIATRVGGHLWFDATETGDWYEPAGKAPALR